MNLESLNQESALKHVRMVEEVQTLVKRECHYRILPREKSSVVLSSSSKHYEEEEDHDMDDNHDEHEHEHSLRSSPRNVMYSASSSSSSPAPQKTKDDNDDVVSSLTSSSSSPSSPSNIILKTMREKICQWMYRVVDHCNFDRKITFIAINYLDRYLHSKNVTDQTLGDTAEKFLQLLGLTALYVACKNEGCKCNLRIFVQLGSGCITADEIKSMEIDLMFNLKWLMNPPIPQEFTEFYTKYVSKFINDIDDQARFIPIIQDVSNYIIEVIIQFSTYQFEKSSVLGAVATLIALDGIKEYIMSNSQKEAVRRLFLTSLMELGVASSVSTRTLTLTQRMMTRSSSYTYSDVVNALSLLSSSSSSRTTSTSRSATTTTIDDILRLESEVRVLLHDQCSSMTEICKGFDPNQFIYDSNEQGQQVNNTNPPTLL